MKYICTDDVENLAAQGKKELIVDENPVLMDLARDTARQLGITIVDGLQPTPPKTPAPAAPASAAKESSPAASKPPAKAPTAATSNGAAFTLSAKPRGCQHGPLPVIPRQAPVKSSQASDGVVDQLVELVRQSIGKNSGS